MLRTLLILFLLGSASAALGQALPTTGQEVPGAAAAAPLPIDPDSPRASVTRFLDLARDGRYAQASAYLAVSEEQRPRAAELSRYLKAVLDRHLWVDLERLSPRSAGDERDGLPPGMDEVGRLQGREPVRVVRLEGVSEPRWVFSIATVSRIDSWYVSLSDRWIRENLPEALLRSGPGEIAWWQWLAVLLIAGLATVGGLALAVPVTWMFRRLFARTRTPWDDLLLARSGGPLRFLIGVFVAGLLLPFLDLYEPGQLFMRGLIRSLGLIGFFWALWRSVDVGVAAIHASSWSQGTSAKSLVSLGRGLTKVLLAALALIAALSALGYPVSGLLAGLGIGGLAVALAAQKTGENLFGSLSLALDRPFDVGDFVRVEDFVGHVETVGLRSTRFRTQDRTLIAIPNGRMADMRIENFTARDRLRLACVIGLVHGTKAPQVRQVLEGIEALLRAHPKIWPEALTVNLKELGASSLDIEVGAWFVTQDWSEFQQIRQGLLIGFMDVVENAGTSLALPTRTIHLAGDAPTVARAVEVTTPKASV